MRTIKFRGQRVDNNEFVYGFYWVTSIATYITADAETKHQDIPVFSATIGQYTGIKDHRQNEIYEGDILKWDSEDGEVTGKVVFKNSDEENLNLSGFVFEIIRVEEYDHDNPIEFTIVGNIHENPELLK